MKTVAALALMAAPLWAQEGDDLRLLREVRELMDRSEEALNQATQKEILEKVDRLMQKAEGQQQGAVERLAELLRKARTPSGPSASKALRSEPQRGPESGSPAPEPYAPDRKDIGKFRSEADRTGRWGDLPARTRQAATHGKRDLDDFPPEFQQLLKEYFEGLTREPR